MGLNGMQLCTPGDVWKCLETFWLLQTGEGDLLLASSGQRARDDAKHSTMHRAVLTMSSYLAPKCQQWQG